MSTKDCVNIRPDICVYDLNCINLTVNMRLFMTNLEADKI